MLYNVNFTNRDGEYVELFIASTADTSQKTRADFKGGVSECDYCVNKTLRELGGFYTFECLEPNPMKLYSNVSDEDLLIRKTLDVSIVVRSREELDVLNEMISDQKYCYLFNDADMVDEETLPRFIGRLVTRYITYNTDATFPITTTIQFEDRFYTPEFDYGEFVELTHTGGFFFHPFGSLYGDYEKALYGMYKPYELLLEILSNILGYTHIIISKEYHHQNGIFEDDLDLRVWLREKTYMQPYYKIVEDILTIYNYRMYQHTDGAFYLVSRDALNDGAALHKANEYIVDGDGVWDYVGTVDTEPDVLNAAYCNDTQYLLTNINIGYKEPYNYLQFIFHPQKRYVQRPHSNKEGDFYVPVEFDGHYLNPEIFKDDNTLGIYWGEYYGATTFLAGDNTAIRYTYFDIDPEGWNTNGDYYNIEFDVAYDNDNPATKKVYFTYVIRWVHNGDVWSVTDNNTIKYGTEIWHTIEVNNSDKQKAEVRYHIPKDEIKTIHNEAKLQIFFVKQNTKYPEYVVITSTKQYPEYTNFDDNEFKYAYVITASKIHSKTKTIDLITGFDIEDVYYLQNGRPLIPIADTEYYSRPSTSIDGEKSYHNIWRWYGNNYRTPLRKFKATIYRVKPITYQSIYYDDDTDTVYELVNDSWDLYTNEHRVEYIENRTIELPYHKVDCDFNNDFSDTDFCVYYLTPYTKDLHNRVTEAGIEEYRQCTLQMSSTDCSESVTATFEYNKCLDEIIKNLSI